MILEIVAQILKAFAVIRHSAIDSGMNSIIAKVFYNKFTIGFERFSTNYVSYFSPQFLFTRGPAEATYGMIPGIGVVYLFELPFIILFFVSFGKVKDKKGFLLLTVWLLSAPIAAALATGPGYAGNRAVAMLPALEIVAAIGLITIPWKKYRVPTILYAAVSVVTVMFFVQKCFTVSKSIAAKAMLYGDLDVASWLSQNSNSSTKVVVDKDLSEPHIYIAFSNKWDPNNYQEATKSWKLEPGINWVDQIPDYKLGNYEFKSVHPEEYAKAQDIFLVAKKEDFKEKFTPTKTFNYPDNSVAIEVVKL